MGLGLAFQCLQAHHYAARIKARPGGWSLRIEDVEMIPRRISTVEARRAVYIDFEGHTDEPPFVLGSLFEDRDALTFTQVLLSDRPNGNLPSLEMQPMDTKSIDNAVSSLIEMARSERRLIAAWSTHERATITQWCRLGEADVRYLDAAYRNCIPIAKTWKARHHPNVSFEKDLRGGRNRLFRYLALVGYMTPAYLGREQTGQRLSYVLNQLESKGFDYRGLTPVAKRKWQALLVHNKHDCVGLRTLMERIAKDG
jgi:hypothetical protein